MLSLIPFVLAAGPAVGYLSGAYLAARFKLPQVIIYIFSAIGFFAGAKETVRIIRLALKTSREY